MKNVKKIMGEEFVIFKNKREDSVKRKDWYEMKS